MEYQQGYQMGESGTWDWRWMEVVWWGYNYWVLFEWHISGDIRWDRYIIIYSIYIWMIMDIIYIHVILQVSSKTQFTMDIKCNFYDDQTLCAWHSMMAWLIPSLLVLQALHLWSFPESDEWAVVAIHGGDHALYGEHDTQLHEKAARCC